MCGIAGLFLKRDRESHALGRMLGGMLDELADRGPDSTGFAIYGDAAPAGAVKATLYSPDPAIDWAALERALGAAFPLEGAPDRHGSHTVFTVRADEAALRDWLARHHPTVRLFGFGARIEVFKDVGLPAAVAQRYGLAGLHGTHALGHTRMATESAVTTEHSHPFSSGADLCLVHNGSLSNHNRLRRALQREGIRFATDNDSEVAAGYLSHRMRQGDTLDRALEQGLADLDGFYTFAVGTRDGFAIVRDAIACKPAVVGETDDWVAMATEYRAIATLPGADRATIWEPQPATVYSWQRQGSTA
ncbi:MAG TPA: glutamine amidotransferase family protein, partial [Candidatus Sulfotelmatobacter sp.]|nr:glutamine amidotransferase family protein [Candidatus Sulfotelmatobacter sp.]